ncbi:hypothetical protein COLO4_16057 [Corchorus olitorius]|uniref:Uncharacterized protein n=1 Tax=Corchorus olitorius TaxID=93759 RepID=A0A1R3JK17_9ROSI|nr:hypothetical protein COLO4_16057 [Corchorus olitorius]
MSNRRQQRWMKPRKPEVFFRSTKIDYHGVCTFARAFRN